MWLGMAVLAGGVFLSLMVGIGVAYVMRLLPIDRRLRISLGLAAALTPWLYHHYLVIRTAGDWLLQESNAESTLSVSTMATGPVIVLAVAAVAAAFPNRLRLVVVALPSFAFLTTWWVTFPLAQEAMPDGRFPFDNIPNIWLFIWTVFGATSGLFVLSRPS